MIPSEVYVTPAVDVDLRLKEVIADDIKRTVMVWSCLSFPANKLYTVDDIYTNCLKKINERKWILPINKIQIQEILDTAFSFSTLTIVGNKEYQISSTITVVE